MPSVRFWMSQCALREFYLTLIRPVFDGNCVIVRWGGKQPKENHQSVGDELDSAQRGQRACWEMAKLEWKGNLTRTRA